MQNSFEGPFAVMRQDAVNATGLITFYNGAFTVQNVRAGAQLTVKDKVEVVTLENAIIPAAIPTTPPTPGAVSVTARSSIAGAAGNISASDIDHVRCSMNILAFTNVEALLEDYPLQPSPHSFTPFLGALEQTTRQGPEEVSPQKDKDRAAIYIRQSQPGTDASQVEATESEHY